MISAQEFKKKDFLEQVNDITEIIAKGGRDAIGLLLDLNTEPALDKAVANMVRRGLWKLLGEDEAMAVESLQSPDDELRSLCIKVAGETGFASAVPMLAQMAGAGATSASDRADALAALARLDPQGHMPLFRHYLNSPDPLLAGVCINALAEAGDQDALPDLFAIIDNAARAQDSEECGVNVWDAVSALAKLGGKDALTFLAANLHHTNPTCRRHIHETLAEKGAEAVPYVAPYLGSQDRDECIMAANVLGVVGDKTAVEALISALDEGLVHDASHKFAVYEALGAAPSMKSLVCLLDALGKEQEESLLMSLVVALDAQAVPPLGDRVGKGMLHALKAAGDNADTILRSMAMSRSTRLLGPIHEDTETGDALMAHVAASNDREILDAFAKALTALGTERALAHAKQLSTTRETAKALRLLAVDDSQAMLDFYRNAASILGFSITCAANGQQALDALPLAAFTVIVVDMNMPVMDGIELTKKIRQNPAYTKTPIIMATTESEKSQAALAKKAGVSAFLKKPFTLDVLQTKIQNILP